MAHSDYNKERLTGKPFADSFQNASKKRGRKSVFQRYRAWIEFLRKYEFLVISKICSEILTDQMIQKSSEHAILTIIVVLTDQSLIRNIPNQDI